MKSFAIEVPVNEEPLIQFIKNGFNSIGCDKTTISISEQEISESVFIKLEIMNNSMDEGLLNSKIAEVITDALFKEYYKNIVNRVLKGQYGYLEVEDIIQVKDKLNSTMPKGYSIEKSVIRDKVYDCIKEYISENNELKLRGFVTFRLKEYVNYLGDEVEKSVDDVFMEKEYNEFIKLLRYFVDIQEPRTEVINVIPDESRYKLYDKDFNLINSEDILDLGSEINETNVSSDDLLISWLITAAPAKVVLHNTSRFNSQALQTINNVFFDKITICPGCEKCSDDNQQFSLEKIKTNFRHNLDNIFK